MPEEIERLIRETIRKMLYPSPFSHWMEGLTNAERVGRIKRSKLSTLRYGLQRFIQSQISAVLILEGGVKMTVNPLDDGVEINLKIADTSVTQQAFVVYPLWLQDFLEEDENFELLLPECEEKIAEVLQRIHEWCLEHPPYDLLVKPT